MAIEKSFNRRPDVILHKIFYDLQRWKAVLKQQEQNELELKMQELKSWYEKFKKARVASKAVDFL